MGKKRAQKDRLYLSATEHAQSSSGYHATPLTTTISTTHHTPTTPFTHCGISHRPFDRQHCVTTPDGYYTFDLTAIVPYINRHHTHPIFNTPLTLPQLIKLHYTSNTHDQLSDPITLKPFTEHTYIVAVKPTGNVYSYDTIHSMCIKPNDMHDLVDGTPFKVIDLITLQNPHAGDDHNKRFKRTEPASTVVSTTAAVRPAPSSTPVTATATGPATVRTGFSNNAAAASFTSTAHNVEYNNTGTELTLKQLHTAQYAYMKKHQRKCKAYVTLHTTLGSLNLQLHADIAPSTAHNFIQHCARGTYTGTKVGKLQAGYCVQAGKSTTGADSTAFGYPITDEFSPALTHSKRGVVSMSNTGGTVKQQFFITFAPCPQLDNKYAVFGEIVGGLDVLTQLENVAVDGDNIPLSEIAITGATIFANPFDDIFEVTDALSGETVRYNEKQAKQVKAKNTAEAVKPQVYTYDTW